MFRDHGTIMITSYYEKYCGVIMITSFYKTYYGIITIRYVLSLLYQEMLGLSRRNPQGKPQGNVPKFIPLLTARMLLNIYASQTKHLQKQCFYTINNHFISFLFAAIIHKPVSFQFQNAYD